MSRSKEIPDNKKIMHHLEEIEELSISEGCIIEVAAKIDKLKNLGAISDRNASVNIKKELNMKKKLTKLKTRNKKIRKVGKG